MPPSFPTRLQTRIPPIQTDPRLRGMDPTAVPGGTPMQPGSRFGALLAGGLGGIGKGMMTQDFRRAYEAGQGGVEGIQKEMMGNDELLARFKSLLDEGFRERMMTRSMT